MAGLSEAQVREEHARLVDVEQQFWLLLEENEALRAQRSHTRTSGRQPSPGAPASNEADVPALEAALAECMDLLLQQDPDHDSTTAAGTVAQFLEWKRRGGHLTVTDAPAAAPPDTAQVALLREELLRTDASRREALGHATRLQQQVVDLSAAVEDLRRVAGTVVAERKAREASDAAARSMRAELGRTEAQLRVAHASHEASLAADTARIRREFRDRSLPRDGSP